MITGPSLPKSMALSLVYHPNSLFNLHHLPPSSSRPCSGLLNRFMSISSSSHSHRLPIFQAMKSSVDLNDQESSNKDSKNTDSKLQMVPSSGNARFSLPNIPVWARWALGALVCLALPFYKRILRIEDGVEKTIETVVETVEKAAEMTEKVASDIADALPEGKLKQSVLEVENIAEQIDDGVEKIEEFLDKVEKIEDKVEDLVEPIIEEGKNKEGESKVQNEASPKTDLPKTTSEPNDK